MYPLSDFKEFLELAQIKKKAIMKDKLNQNMHSQLQTLADVTKSLIQKGDIEAAKGCLKTVEEIYNNGSPEAKNDVSNVYIFSVTSFMELHHCNIKNLFPKTLLTEYYKQVNTLGL